MTAAYLPKIGHLIWIAKPLFSHFPTPEDVKTIDRWRWPIFFPLAKAMQQQIVQPVAQIGLTPELSVFPKMRSGSRRIGWRQVAFVDNHGPRVVGAATDPSMPIYKVVNDTRLREMILGHWTPEQEW